MSVEVFQGDRKKGILPFMKDFISALVVIRKSERLKNDFLKKVGKDKEERELMVELTKSMLADFLVIVKESTLDNAISQLPRLLDDQKYKRLAEKVTSDDHLKKLWREYFIGLLSVASAFSKVEQYSE